MAISKVDFAGRTLIDLTADTITAADLRHGVTAHDKSGDPIVGTASGAGGEIKTGTFTADRDMDVSTNPLLIRHGLSDAPDFVVLHTTSDPVNKALYEAVYIRDVMAGTISVVSRIQGKSRYGGDISPQNTEVTVNKTEVRINAADKGVYCPAGQAYTWVAGRF